MAVIEFKFFIFYFFWFQAGEFFYSAHNSASAHHKETEAQLLSSESIDRPLLSEQVCYMLFFMRLTFTYMQ